MRLCVPLRFAGFVGRPQPPLISAATSTATLQPPTSLAPPRAAFGLQRDGVGVCDAACLRASCPQTRQPCSLCSHNKQRHGGKNTAATARKSPEACRPAITDLYASTRKLHTCQNGRCASPQGEPHGYSPRTPLFYWLAKLMRGTDLFRGEKPSSFTLLKSNSPPKSPALRYATR